MAALRMASLWESRVSADEASSSSSSPTPPFRGGLMNSASNNNSNNSNNSNTGGISKKSVSPSVDMRMPMLETSSAMTPSLSSSLSAFKAGAAVSPATTPEKSDATADTSLSGALQKDNKLARSASGKRPPLFPLRGSGGANADTSVDLVASPVSDDAPLDAHEEAEEEDDDDDDEYVSVQEEDVDMDLDVEERFVPPAQGLRKLKEALAGLDTKLDGVQDALERLAVRVAELQRGSGNAPGSALKTKAVVV